jgi:hypothetical protein
VELLTQARDDAAEILRDDPQLATSKHQAIRSAVLANYGASLHLIEAG